MSLREALEKLTASKQHYSTCAAGKAETGSCGCLRGLLEDLLAAHPEPATAHLPNRYGETVEIDLDTLERDDPEPATGVTEQAVEAAEREVDSWPDDASFPWLPEGGKESAIRGILRAAQPYMGVRPVGQASLRCSSCENDEFTCICGALVSGGVLPVRPVVDREAVRRLLFDWIGGLGVDEGAVADAVMDLLTGGGSETTDEASTLS